VAEELERLSLLPYIGSRALVAMGNVRVMMLFTSGVLTAGTLADFMATGDRLVLLIGLFWPLLYRFRHALGMALFMRVMPLMIERMVGRWKSRFQQSLEDGQLDVGEPRLGLGPSGRLARAATQAAARWCSAGARRRRLSNPAGLGPHRLVHPGRGDGARGSRAPGGVLAERIEQVPPGLEILRER
jgi:hypothetical protein